jgi:hypothetical protein
MEPRVLFITDPSSDPAQHIVAGGQAQQPHTSIDDATALKGSCFAEGS